MSNASSGLFLDFRNLRTLDVAFSRSPETTRLAVPPSVLDLSLQCKHLEELEIRGSTLRQLNLRSYRDVRIVFPSTLHDLITLRVSQGCSAALLERIVEKTPNLRTVSFGVAQEDADYGRDIEPLAPLSAVVVVSMVPASVVSLAPHRVQEHEMITLISANTPLPRLTRLSSLTVTLLSSVRNLQAREPQVVLASVT